MTVKTGARMYDRDHGALPEAADGPMTAVEYGRLNYLASRGDKEARAALGVPENAPTQSASYDA